MPDAPARLEAREQPPHLVRADHGVDRDHPGVGERDHGRRLQAWQQRLELTELGRGCVHHQVLAAAGRDHGAEHRHDAVELVRRAGGGHGVGRARMASEARMSPMARRPFIARVEPVDTRSTIASARPSRGATSTAPDREMTSTGMPWSREEAPRDVGMRGGDADAGQVRDRLVGRVRRRRGRQPAAAVAQVPEARAGRRPLSARMSPTGDADVGDAVR